MAKRTSRINRVKELIKGKIDCIESETAHLLSRLKAERDILQSTLDTIEQMEKEEPEGADDGE